MVGVTFGSYHSYGNFLLLLKKKEIESPTKIMLILSALIVFQIPEIELKEGSNNIFVSGTGTVTFKYRKGRLWIFSQNSTQAQSYVPSCYIIKPKSSTGINGNINIYAMGKIA